MMKNSFKNEATGPDYYYGRIIEINGVPKIEWREPGKQREFLTEEGLRKKEEASRLTLCRETYPMRSQGWEIQRNIHHSAEHGLIKLQNYKREKGIALTTPLYLNI